MASPVEPRSALAGIERPSRVGVAGEEPVDVDDERFAGGAVGHEVVPDADRLEPARDLGQAQVDPGGVARVDHLAAFVDIETHRLLEHDVLAGGGRGEDVGQVCRVRGGDDDGVDVRAIEQGLDRRLGLGAELGGECRCARAARDRHQPGSARAPVRRWRPRGYGPSGRPRSSRIRPSSRASRASFDCRQYTSVEPTIRMPDIRCQRSPRSNEEHHDDRGHIARRPDRGPRVRWRDGGPVRRRHRGGARRATGGHREGRGARRVDADVRRHDLDGAEHGGHGDLGAGRRPGSAAAAGR